MKRLSFAAAHLIIACQASLLVVACKSDPPAPTPEASASPPNPHATAPSGTPAGGPLTPNALQPTSPPNAPPSNAHGTPPTAAQTPPRPLEKLADGRVVLGPFSIAVPASWSEKPSTSSMRAAQYQLPAPNGGEAEVVVYHFGESGAGSVQANIDRWLGQFKQPDDKPSKDVAKIEKAELAGQEASLVSVSGRYVAPAMPGGAPVDKPDQALVAAIVPSPQGPYYFRLVGSKAVVAEQEPKFREALRSLKLK
jgi:hypothetical protein